VQCASRVRSHGRPLQATQPPRAAPETLPYEASRRTIAEGLIAAARFTEITDPAMVAVTPSTVLAYNGVHLIRYLAFGVLAAAVAKLADRG
jgi:hypothetical protein